MSAEAPKLEEGKEIKHAAEDVSELLERLDQLELYRSVLEQISDSVIVTDPDGTITYVNPAFERVTGYSSEEAIGKNPSILKSGVHDHAFYAELWKTIASGQTWSGRFVDRRKDGTRYTEDATITPIFDDSGEIAHYVAVKRDLTKELALQGQLVQAQKLESVGRLAGGIAHDFNNLLTSIISFTRFVLDDLATEDPRRDDLAEVLRAADSAVRLTKQLLSFARRRPVDLAVLDINDSLRRIVKILRRTMGTDVELVAAVCDRALHVQLDAGQLDQLVFNLAVNARDAMPEGGVLTITTEPETVPAAHPTLPAGDYALVRFRDTGRGIPADKQDRIFEPFFTTKGEKGTGLGLATCYGIVTQAKGQIVVEESSPSGTSFTVRLPLESPASNVVRPTIEEVAPASQLSGTALVVEDQPPILRLMARSLKRLGFEVIEARTAEEALAVLGNGDRSVDLVVADLILPGLSGAALAEQLADRFDELRIVLTSGYIDAEQAVSLKHTPRSRFLAKPFTTDQLTAEVEALFREPPAAA